MEAPKNCLRDKTQFGRVPDAVWNKGMEAAQLAAADIQHRCAIAMRRCIKAQYKTMKAYCEQTGQSYQRISQVLCGSIPMSLQDVGNAVSSLGISVAFLDQYSEVGMKTGKLAGDTVLRDALGAFYTPVDIAEHMIDELGVQPGARVLEPSFGEGAFLRALRNVGVRAATACDIDPAACDHATAENLVDDAALYRGSFFDFPADRRFDAVVGNPPYVRLRALDGNEAARLIAMGDKYLPAGIGEESSEWLPFLLKATGHLKDGGGIAFVLPFDFTYVRYARTAWTYLGGEFDGITVSRVRERIFDDILQDVILFVAKGKGGSTETVRYRCFETKADLLEGRACVDAEVSIAKIAVGERPFQHAFVDDLLCDALDDTPHLVRTSQEAELHIGYVCGNKDFFHPSSHAIANYDLPDTSLKPAVVSSRQLGGKGLRTSDMQQDQHLWLPGANLEEGENRYVKRGEREGVHNGYKCRVRNPWWKVPGVSTPDLVMSVFGEAPRMLINDGGWVVSNSLLGVTLREGVSAMKFAASWYSSITLLSVELEVHSLGGGVLVAVPRESSRVMKLAASLGDGRKLRGVDRALRANDLQAAYMANDTVVENTFGKETAEGVWRNIELIRRWRKR